MSIYAIGDIQGCFECFLQLLKKIHFKKDRDRLWLVGDLVNRGPHSLETLQWLYAHKENINIVLGNHDLHLLAVWLGNKKYHSQKDTFLPIIKDSKYSKILRWLQSMPLVHWDPEYRTIMVHAGVPPQWDIQTLMQRAKRANISYQNTSFFKRVYGNYPNEDSLQGHKFKHNIYTINALTRMRYCQFDGKIFFHKKQPPTGTERSIKAWFTHKNSLPNDVRIIFGHWSTLRFANPSIFPKNIIPTDHGCVWGGCLSAFKIEKTPKKHYTSQRCPTFKSPQR